MTKNVLHLGWLGVLLFLLAACAPSPPPPQQGSAPDQMDKPDPQAAAAKTELARAQDPTALPVRFQQPNYAIAEPDGTKILGHDQDVVIQVGADISSSTPVPLRDIMKRLAALKNMNLSWASDVDQYALVDVNIRAEDDFFQAIDNLLRQLDYSHEVKDNTIIINYKETRRFHIAMPFLNSTYETGVGGDVLGGSKKLEDDSLKGNIKLYSSSNKFNIWDNIRKNLDNILEIWSEPTPAPPPAAAGAPAAGAPAAAPAAPAAGAPAAAPPAAPARTGKGYYSIDEPIGLITVTAPRVVLDKVASYIDNLKKEIYRQVSIEAKILEVQLNDSSTKGIDWTNVVSKVKIGFHPFGPDGIIYSPETSNRVISQVDIASGFTVDPFTAVVNAIETQGRTKILANPRISVMNGQPALISVGENISYINEIDSSVNDSGVITSTVKTSSVLSGLGLSVVPTIMDDGIVLSMTPVTSECNPDTDIQRVSVGTLGQVMLPQIHLREMNTLVQIKNGGMLVVGGLIDETDDTTNTKVPILGDLPLINKLFRSETKNKVKKELVILLRPQII
ncbi:MAG: pilus (MSHA type) biogenesis protein MshL [Desulfobacteraceae bacterium]|nr:pilus (MSHA type) biogenesis protein MshL [Desulfobacteraceae bacterium]